MAAWGMAIVRRAAERAARCFAVLALLLLARAGVGFAQSAPTATSSPADITAQSLSTTRSIQPGDSETSETNDDLTLFPHSEDGRYWISGQVNVILQWHPSFAAAYSGTNSLHSTAENATSKLYTLFLGYRLTHTTEVFLDMESAEGHGISNALGLAGFTNLDVVRNPSLSYSPYVARIMVRQIIPLSHCSKPADRDEFHLATTLPLRRLEFRLGKFSMADFFDLNSWGSDSHLQFLNWTVDNNGAYDYAANTRGYTDGAILEFDDDWWTVRFGETLMPKVANGIFLDADIARARSENLELEARGNLIAGKRGVVRVLSYLNHANMGNYREAIENYFADGETAPPDIIATRMQGRHKFGFGLNFEQEISKNVGVFGRVGWSDGRNESFVYTEADRTVELGAFTKGGYWRRRNDRAGVAFVANGIVAAHQEYLALGGLGFLLGDGGLTYGPEKVVEGFYTAHIWRGFFASFDLQHINNPGYNMARGPATVPGVRVHLDL
jgi:high affinity Mn2+ porin